MLPPGCSAPPTVTSRMGPAMKVGVLDAPACAGDTCAATGGRAWGGRVGEMLPYVAILLLTLGWMSGADALDGEPAATGDLARAVDTYLEGPVKDRRFTGVVLIASNGKAVVRKAYGFADWPRQTPNTPETGFMIFSVTKQFTAAAILRLADHGKLSTRDPVSRHVANWPKEWEAVTIHHLLAHSSGIDVDTLAFWLFRYHPEYWADPDQKPPSYEPRPLLSEPGTTLRYSNAGYTVLSMIAARVGGKPFREVMQVEVFGPLGMERSGLEGTHPTPARARGHLLSPTTAEYQEQKTRDIVGAGDMVTTVDDLLRWDEALYGDGFLSDTARRAMFTPHGKAKLGSFGYAWLIQDRADGPPRFLFSGGGAGFTSCVIRRPDRHLYLAMLANNEMDGLLSLVLGLEELVEGSWGRRREP